MQRFCLCLCLSLVAAAAGAADVPTVHCPAEAPLVRELVLAESWRLDPDDPDTPLMGVITDAKAGPDGRLYLLDMQLCQVLVLGPDGALEAVLGREGDGPGEFRRSDSLVLYPDGDLGVQQSYPFRVERLHPDGTPAGRWSCTRQGVFCERLRALGDGLLVCSRNRDYARSSAHRAASAWQLAIYGESAEPVHELLGHEYEISFQPPIYDEATAYFPVHAWDVVQGSTVVLAPDRERYRLEYRDAAGALLRVVERPLTPRPRDDEDRRRVAESVTYTSGGEPVQPECRLLDTEPMIQRVMAMPDGSVRVRHSRHPTLEEAGKDVVWDVHAPDGTLREQLWIRHPAEPRDGDRWFLLSDDRAVCVHNFAAASRNYWSAYLTIDEEEEAALDDEEVLLTISCWTMQAAPTP